MEKIIEETLCESGENNYLRKELFEENNYFRKKFVRKLKVAPNDFNNAAEGKNFSKSNNIKSLSIISLFIFIWKAKK